VSIDIEGMLRGLGLEHYSGSFRDNEIDAEMCQGSRTTISRSSAAIPGYGTNLDLEI